MATVKRQIGKSKVPSDVIFPSAVESRPEDLQVEVCWSTEWRNGMIDQERLEKGLYWQKAWTLIDGCRKVSPGCDNCWAEAQAKRFSNHPNEKISERANQVLWFDDADYPQGFAGNVLLREDNLDLPLRTRKPTVFAIWNDLYHEDVTDEFRDRAYAVMALCQQHIFLVLTKRAERMAAYFVEFDEFSFDWTDEWRSASYRVSCDDDPNGSRAWHDETARLEDSISISCKSLDESGYLPNVWHGVTAENQEMADQRIPYLLKVPGNKFISIEPMIAPVNFVEHLECDQCGWTPFKLFAAEREMNALAIKRWDSWKCPQHYNPYGSCDGILKGIDAVLLGGESGKNARPLHPDWVRSVRDQCAEAGVSFYFKQWGEWVPAKFHGDQESPGFYRCENGECIDMEEMFPKDSDEDKWLKWIEEKTYVFSAGSYWADPVTCFSATCGVRVGKKKAGRTLDGRTHDDLPWLVKP